MPAALPKKSHSYLLVKRLLVNYLLPYRMQVLWAVFFMALSGGATAAIAALMQPVLDDVLFNGKENLIIPVSAAVALTFAARGITTYVHTVLMSRVGHSIVADVQSNLFSHFLHLDMAFFHANPSGQLLSRVVNDVNVMRSTVTTCLTGFGKSLFTLIFLVGVMFYQDWKLTLAAFIVFPMLSLFVVYIGRRLRKLSKNIQSQMGNLSDLLSQTFQGIRLVKAYGAEDYEATKTHHAITALKNLNIKALRVSTISTPVNEIVVGAVFAAIITYGGFEVLAGRLTAGQLASFIAAFTLAYEPMKKLANINNSLQMGLGATERIFAMLDTPSKINDAQDAMDLVSTTPTITFDHVGFSYEGSDLRALEDVSFEAKPGTITALVGPSGGGKSTIMNLIPRFYDVSAGAVRIDGHDIRDITQVSLRRSIALVSQDITIFNDSVFNNIRYGRRDASDEDVFEAARAAAAHEFIEGLEQGYETVLGEHGVKLSGGQKQRLSIARAILSDAPILLLDEATSALDNESEKLVQEALKRLQEGRTTLAIAHRLSTVQQAEHIIVLDRGAIAEEGTHEELMQLGQLYAGMYKTGLREE